MTDQNQIDVYEFVEIPSEPGFECNRIGQVRKVGTNKVKKLTVLFNLCYQICIIY